MLLNDAKLQAEWVAKLRSGEYTQGRGNLRSRDNKFCCLGVLCDLVGLEWKTDETNPNYPFYIDVPGDNAVAFPPETLLGQLNCKQGTRGYSELWSLASANDNGLTFAQIADQIESLP